MRENKLNLTATYNYIRKLGLNQKIARVSELLQDGRNTIIFTHYVDGVQDRLLQGLIDNGFDSSEFSVHNGGLKELSDYLSNPHKKHLIASVGATGTGTDGLQMKADRIIHVGFDWTYQALQQCNKRIDRRGQPSSRVDIHYLRTRFEGYHKDKFYSVSFDEHVLNRHQQKKLISDIAVDGFIDHLDLDLFSDDEIVTTIDEKLNLLRSREVSHYIGVQLHSSLENHSDLNSPVIHKANGFSEISRYHARCRSSKSATNFDRIQNDPAEWLDYQALLTDSRSQWSSDPVNEVASIISSMGNGFRVFDFGCGMGLLNEQIGSNNEVVGFDYFSLDENVIQCDLANEIPDVKPADIGVSINSLMSLDYESQVQNYHSLLKGNGQLFLVNPLGQIPPSELEKCLKSSGFSVVSKRTNVKFVFFRCVMEVK